MNKPKQKIYYHFSGATLRNGQPIPPVGKWLKHKGKLVPCESGLHASEHPFDALHFAPGHMLHRVVLRGKVIPHGNPVDKVCARERKIVATINAGKMCRAFACRVALDVIDKWDAPKIVLDYLKTGDESLREAAKAAAWNSAKDASLNAARAAAWNSACADVWNSAWFAAKAAAWNSAWAVTKAAACAAARNAARDAAFQKYRVWFAEMVDAEFANQSEK